MFKELIFVRTELKCYKNNNLMKICFLGYDGPRISANLNKEKGRVFRGIIKLSQFVSDEKDKMRKCKNYPFGPYKSYRHCDEIQSHSFMKQNFGLAPFWTSTNLSEVTKNV